MSIISKRVRKQLTLAEKLTQFPEALAAWDAFVAAGAAVKTAAAAKTAALAKVGRHSLRRFLSKSSVQA